MARTVLLTIWLLLILNTAWGRTGMRYYNSAEPFNSAEPDSPVYIPEHIPETPVKISRQTSLARLTAVRQVLVQANVDAYIIPTADAHNNAYISPSDARREWVSGLQGSSGTAVVTQNYALVWTDARYYTQFYLDVDTTLWGLKRQGEDESIQEWLINNLAPNSVVGIDPTTYSRNSWTALETALNRANLTLLPTYENLIDEARRNVNDGPPSRPANDLMPLTMDFTVPEHIPETPVKISRQTSLARLTAVRQVLVQANVDAYIIPTADAHNNAYISPSDARREWVSGLQGSSGTAVVTQNYALVWTDARYYTQFYLDVDTTLWGLKRQGEDESIQEWLINNLAPNSVVGIDPTTYSRNSWTALETALNRANLTLLPTYENLIDEARRNVNDGPPSRPANDLMPLTMDFTGRRSADKISDLISQMRSRGATVLIITALDEIAYTLNLRGTDIPYNPVFFAYLVIRNDVSAPSNVLLFWNEGLLSTEVTQHLTSEAVTVEARPYGDIFGFLRNLTNELSEGSSIWLSEDGSHAVYLAVENDGLNNFNIISTVSPVALMKVVKNQIELEGFRKAHIKDGVAVCRAFFWVHEQVDAGIEVTEVQFSDKLVEFRREEDHSAGPSFATIAGAGENGAVIHYRPDPEGEQRVITRQDMLLVDSGGQYFDGTTDITRTRHMGTPTDEQIMAFTRVLKGQINLATAVFPAGTQGHVIEVLARKYLWDVGLNYGHGTGHGVGHFLNVHEGPTWILSGPAANDPGIRPNMIYSNEPGFYKVGEYGIRHEDLVETIVIDENADHLLAGSMEGDFDSRGAVGFYTISLVPHQQKCIDVELLTDFEIKYLNDYHARVLSTIGPILQEREYDDVYEWLEQECAPIVRSSAFLVMATPLITVISVVAVLFK